MKTIKTLVPLIVVAIVLGVFILATAESDAEEKIPETVTEPVEISHDEAAEYLEDGENFFPLTEDERKLVISIVAAEARGENLEGMMAVAQSIRDRAITRNQSIEQVCLSPYQYAAPYAGEVSDMLIDSVMFVFDEGHSPLEFPTTHFYQHEMIDAPDWTAGLTCRGSIGAHTFFG